MFRSIKLISLMAGVLIATVSIAQAPAGAPAGSTGLCRDGSYWSGATKKGACRGHKGVQDWYGAAAPAGSTAAAPAAPAAPATAAPAAAAPKAAAMPAEVRQQKRLEAVRGPLFLPAVGRTWVGGHRRTEDE